PIAAQGLQGVDEPGQRPTRHQFGDMVLQAFAPRSGLIERVEHLAEHRLMRRRAELQPSQPDAMLLRPRLADVADLLAQQEAGDALPTAQQVAPGSDRAWLRAPHPAPTQA